MSPCPTESTSDLASARDLSLRAAGLISPCVEPAYAWEMLVRLGWPNCNSVEYGPRAAREPVDAFWLECTPDEAARLVQSRMSSTDRASIAEVDAQYGWPHHFEGEDRCCFLVARDLGFVRALPAHYPFHQLWNAYSPFRDLLPTPVETLDELTALPSPAGDITFAAWVAHWIELAEYSGIHVPMEKDRIAAVVALWRLQIPAGWERGRDAQLLDRRRRYRRGATSNAHVPRGEHAVEREILRPSPRRVTTTCLGGRLVDGVNAVPLTKDAGGGRKSNVEADMLLLVRDALGYRLQLAEVKA